MNSRFSRPIFVKFIGALAVAMVSLAPFVSSSHADPAGAQKTDVPNPRAAAIASFRTNLDYCHPWLTAKDYKSLGQSVGALSILAGAIARHTGEAGQPQIESLQKAIADLTAAAKAADNAKAEKAIDAL